MLRLRQAGPSKFIIVTMKMGYMLIDKRYVYCDPLCPYNMKSNPAQPCTQSWHQLMENGDRVTSIVAMHLVSIICSFLSSSPVKKEYQFLTDFIVAWWQKFADNLNKFSLISNF